jgi:hypothetical protein
MSIQFVTKNQIHIMKAEFIQINKERGESYLALNTSNRTPRKSYVRHLREAFRRGEYVTTHQGIAISQSGILIDGQHRLLALKELNWPSGIVMLVVTGLPDEAAAVVDIGAKRSYSDVLRMAFDVSLHSMICAAYNCILKDRSGWSASANRSTPDQLISLHREFCDDIHAVRGVTKYRYCAATLAAWTVAHSQNAEVIEGMVEQFVSGANLDEGDPLLTLRNFLGDNKKGSSSPNRQMERFRKTTRALDAAVKGERLTRLHA